MYEQNFNPYRRNIAVIKEYFKSPAVLALGILQIAAILMSVIQSIVSADLNREIVTKLAAYFDSTVLSNYSGSEMAYQISKALNESAQSAGSFSFFSSIPVFGILSIIAIFLIYFQSRNDNPDSAPTAGVTILHVLSILSLVICVILVVCSLLLAAALFILYAEFKKSSALDFDLIISGKALRIDASVILILAIIFTIVAIICSAIALFYYINRKRYFGSIKSSMTTVELSCAGARPYGIFCVISAVSAGLSFLSSIPSLFLNGKEMLTSLDIGITSDVTLPAVISLLASAISLAVIILRAKLALGYAKHIENYKYNYNEPAASREMPIGVGSHTQQNPYTYLAQQNTEVSMKEATFVNPYVDRDEENTESAQTVCPNCGAPTDGKAPFCGQCGFKL